MAAPICRLQPPPPTFDSTAPNLPAIPLVTLNIEGWNIPPPIALQLQAMVQAINSLRNVIMLLGGRGPPPNNIQSTPLQINGPPGSRIGGVRFPPDQRPPSSKGSTPKQPQQKKQKKSTGGSFTEVSRSTKKVRVKNPDDDTQYVDVEQITSLVMQNSTTGETWEWRFE